MSEEFIPQMIPLFGEEETSAMNDYMKSGGFIMEFKKTQEFEQMIGDFVKSDDVVAVCNGTISMTLAAYVGKIGYGDEVIVPNYTMIATPNSVKMLGASPVFVDVCPKTLCMDLDKAKQALTEKTKALIFVNANGRYPKEGINKFKEFCEENNLLFIEDAAQALGCFYPDGRHMGTVGDFGSISFSVPKIISTGQGGAIIINNKKFVSGIKKSKDFGRSGGGNDIHDEIGWNFKFTDIQAVIGVEQMKKLPDRIKRKKEILIRYMENLADIEEIEFFEQDLSYTTPWFIDVKAKNRDDLAIFLKNNNIGTRHMYPPINKQECYNVKGEHEVSNMIGEFGLWLPSSVQLTNGQIDCICNKIKEFYK